MFMYRRMDKQITMEWCYTALKISHRYTYCRHTSKKKKKSVFSWRSQIPPEENILYNSVMQLYAVGSHDNGLLGGDSDW